MSNQISVEEMQKRGSLLKKAKQIMLQEYAAIRTQQHQQWIRDSETSWRTNGVLMAYPPAKLYPTEQEVVDKALELYNKSIAASALGINTPITTNTTETKLDISTTNSNEPIIVNPSSIEPLGCSPDDVTSKLQEVYNRASSVPIDPRSIGIPMNNYTETLTIPVIEQPEPIAEITVEEPTTEEPLVEESEEIQPKHSLLRSVLSGWLSKNKDKEI
jgi:hypothetical protein